MQDVLDLYTNQFVLSLTAKENTINQIYLHWQLIYCNLYFSNAFQHVKNGVRHIVWKLNEYESNFFLVFF